MIYVVPDSSRDVSLLFAGFGYGKQSAVCSLVYVLGRGLI